MISAAEKAKVIRELERQHRERMARHAVRPRATADEIEEGLKQAERDYAAYRRTYPDSYGDYEPDPYDA